MRTLFWCVSLCCVLLTGFAAANPPASAAPEAITVVLDDNYPPYVFRDDQGTLQGYLVDLWRRWEKQTGVSVHLKGQHWQDALETMRTDRADVIDTIFENAERREHFDFSPAYADIPVSIYADANIGGLGDLSQLHGFTVGTKKGDDCATRLTREHIAIRAEFQDYQSLIDAALSQDVRIFCLDEPPANYLLHKANADKLYRKTLTLYTGQFHRAFRKGDVETQKLVQDGFQSIPDNEQRQIKEKWFGNTTSRDIRIFLLRSIPIILLITGILLTWNFLLRRKVRQKTRELLNERRHLETVFRTIPDMIWLKDVNGVYLSCNAQFERFFGAPQEKILGKTDYDFVSKELADFFREKDRRALENDTPTSNDEWVTFADTGRQALLETIKTPMRDANGIVIGVLGIARDVTLYHNTQSEILALQQRFESAFRASPVGACIIGANDSCVIEINSRFAADFGWMPQELMGKPFGDTGLWCDASDYQRWQADLAQTESLSEWTTRWFQRGGNKRWVSLSASRLELAKEPGILIHAVDFTPRHQAEGLLEAQREILELIAGGAPLQQTLEALANVVEREAPGMLAVALLLDKEGKRLHHGAAPSIPKAYLNRIEGITIGPKVGACGTAAYLKQVVITEDISTDPAWSTIADFALSFNLRACWSAPIMDKHNQVLGTFALYYDRVGRPTEHQRRLIDMAAQTASIAITRDKEDAALRSSEAFNKLLFADSNLPYVVLDARTGLIIDGNVAAAKAYGVSARAHLIGLNPLDVSAAQQSDGTPSLAAATEAINLCLERGEHIVEWRHQRPDGTIWDAEIRLIRFKMDGKTLIQTAIRDISERKKIEESLRLAAKVFENTDEGITITDKDGLIVAVNHAFTTITGYAESEALGRNPKILQSGRHDPEFYQEMWQSLLEQGSWRGEIWNKHKSGQIYPQWLTISAAKNAHGTTTHYVAVFSDISSLKQTELALDYQAHHDPLTNLPNRKLLKDRMEHAILRAKRLEQKLAVLFIDLDRFKNVNDTLGHSVGDALLVEATQRMTSGLRASDTLARWGGDEFVLLIEEDVSAESVKAVADRVLQTFRQPLKVDNHEIDITASIGATFYPDNALDIDTLLSQADMAMYQTKGEGRNGLSFYEARLGSDVEERMKIETALRRVVGRRELLLHYQPQINLLTGEISGVEALVRWKHPELGLVSPARFIPIAEDTGAIHEIGEWVLQEACQQMTQWKAAGLRIPRVAVNLSAQQIEELSLLTTIESLLQACNMRPEELELEVTESSLMRRMENVSRVLDGLREQGLQLSVDDFGTGYSSLAYLKRLPVHRLKIDRSFVKDIGLDANDEALVRAITALGHSLSLELVAEGVERPDQVEFLRMVGCEIAQGYLFGRPMPSEELAQFVRDRMVQTA